MPYDKAPCPLGQIVVGVFVLGLVKDLPPVLEIVPCFFDRGASKGRISGQGLVQHAPQRPVINAEIVGLAAKNLRGHIVGRPHHRVGLTCGQHRRGREGLFVTYVVFVIFPECPICVPALPGGALGNVHVLDLLEFHFYALHALGRQLAGAETEIGEFDVAGGIDEEVLGLQVAVDVAEFVQSIDRSEHLGDVEPGMSEMQDASVIEQRSEIASGDILLQSEKQAMLAFNGRATRLPAGLGILNNRLHTMAR